MAQQAQSNLVLPRGLSSLDLSNATLFKLQFSRFPNLEFSVFQVVLPGMTFGETVQPTAIYDIKLPGDKLLYDPLVVSFLVQEDFENYFEIVRWMYGLAKPITTEQRRELEQKKHRYSDAILTMLTNKRNPYFRFKFINCFPISISSLTLDATMVDAGPLTADVTLQFMNMESEKI
ncbi:MAG: phage tail protein [Patescibacteria group bacterium]|nr:phage tail protein [Patescibacteria group bacterium]